jgi:hypothetical protein
MSKQKVNKLKESLEQMLVLANNKLALAKSKNKEWDIEHYKNDVLIVENQLKEII